MTTVQIQLPDELAQDAQAAGLLAPKAMATMLREQLRKQAGEDLRATWKRILEIAKRLPNLTRTTRATLAAQGYGHAILGQIVTLIDKHCALTIRRLSASSADGAAH